MLRQSRVALELAAMDGRAEKRTRMRPLPLPAAAGQTRLSRRSRNNQEQDEPEAREHCDQRKSQPRIGHKRRQDYFKPCDRAASTTSKAQLYFTSKLTMTIAAFVAALALMALASGAAHAHTHHNSSASSSVLIDQQQQQQQQQAFFAASGMHSGQQQQSVAGGNNQQSSAAAHNSQAAPVALAGAHLQPSFVYGARNKSANFTHVLVDELTGSVYIGATNLLLQLSAANLKAEFALKTGPALENSRDCAPADCLAHIGHIDTSSLANMHHAHGADLSIPTTPSNNNKISSHNHNHYRHQGQTMHTAAAAAAAAALSSNETAAASPHSASYTFQPSPAAAGGSQRSMAPTSSSSSSSTSSRGSSSAAAPAPATTAATIAGSSSVAANQMHNNNYNKILAIEPDSRQLIVCGSLNQGACRRHQLGVLTNYSELIPLPVASNDEHSSNVALIGNGGGAGGSGGSAPKQRPIMYVAATNSRLGPYREMVPAISARYLEPASRAMQIIERSFTDSARVDISYELRDYYLVNYVHAFQHNDFVYFATVQRKSPLRSLEEWGYVSRLARLCLSDLSFQSYTEITLECKSAGQQQQQSSANHHDNYHQQQRSSSSSSRANQQQRQQQQQQAAATGVNYNLLQDAYVTSAGSHLAQQLGIRAQSAVLVGAFALSKDHTTRSQQRSAICLFPLAQIEQKFNENIHMCYNGSLRARNMNYIAGSVNDCPKPGKAGNIANFCNEPIKLNGSLPLTATPVLAYDDVLLTSIAATQAPTSPLNLNADSQQHYSQQQQQASVGGLRRHLAAAAGASNSARQHQVLLAGTSSGALKRVALVSGDYGLALKGVEFDSVQVDEHQQDPILADMHLSPANNPQVTGAHLQQQQPAGVAQFVIAATASKLVKLRINQCKAVSRPQHGNRSTSAASDECNFCAQLQDPFCGWCASTSSCSSHDECLLAAFATPTASAAHWQPFDQIKCADYQPVAPQFVPIQTSGQQAIDVNIRIQQQQQQQQPALRQQQWDSNLAFQLAQAQFTCHFDYLALANRSAPAPHLSGATTKATQARLNLHTSTVVIACPLPPPNQRPRIAEELHLWGAGDQLRARLTVRLVAPTAALGNGQVGRQAELGSLQQLLGMRLQHQQPFEQMEPEIEREIGLYDCTVHSSCRSCLTAGSGLPPATSVGRHAHSSSADSMMLSEQRGNRRWSCAWCPLSNRCTFNSSHPDLGCAASAVISTTPHSALPSPSSNSVRGSHLTQSLDQAQATVFGISIERLAQCPASSANELAASAPPTATSASTFLSSPASSSSSSSSSSTVTVVVDDSSSSGASASGGAGGAASGETSQATKSEHQARKQQGEILIPNNSRRSIQVSLRQAWQSANNKPQRTAASSHKLECLVEVEGARARLSAKLLDAGQLVVCQEAAFTYQEEIATQRAQLLVVQGDNQVIEMFDVILYKCHLFGVSPPALTSTVGASGGAQHSSAAWRAHELLQFAAPALSQQRQQQQLAKRQATPSAGLSDCSLCLNVERKYQCAWCSNQCQHADHCTELQASTCPPPRIDSIHPTAGPLEGGTLLTIEGSNLGSNEREIQDKISVGGEPCQLVMYSVSTRIVCKTGPSFHGPQSATVFVGNRAGVTSAYEKFHYKAVHLTDVNPRIGPVSGGTRLYLTGSNLNIGSRVQIFLDEIPCSLDRNDITSNQITCTTAPNLLASSMRITKLTLMIDNSTHYLPYPFTYQPDPVITSIEPAESFVSGGRLILISGQHLSSPQSTKLMVYNEHRHSIINGTNCITQNDTLITCLTPALSREIIANLLSPPQTTTNQDLLSTGGDQQQQEAFGGQPSLSYDSGGLKLKMSLLMDDVRSSRNLDEYYHHLPHYLTYYDDPQLFRLPSSVVDYTEELVISGENLKMKQLDQDMLFTIGSHICTIKSVAAHQVVCEPPAKIAPVYDENGRLLDRPILPIVGLVGSNLRYQIGHMKYSSRQYQLLTAGESSTFVTGSNLLSSAPSLFSIPSMAGNSNDLLGSSGNTSPGVIIIICLSVVGFIVGFVATFMFAMARFRQSKAEREYKRIQLQMGSLDINGQPINGNLFDKIHLSNHCNGSGQLTVGHHNSNVRTRALDYVGGAFAGKKLFYQLNQPSFPPSPLTDISSLTGSNPMAHNQHVVKLSSNGTIISSTIAAAAQQHIYNSTNSSSSQSSPGSTRNSGQLFSQGGDGGNNSGFAQQQMSKNLTSEKSNLLSSSQQQQNQQTLNGVNSARNFSWTQEAPSTIVPYAVIEACDLTFEGKSAIKEYV